jgi:hypothetical protein
MTYFFANTEYHLLIALLLVHKYNLDISSFEIILFKSKYRFIDVNTDSLPIRFIDYSILVKARKSKDIPSLENIGNHGGEAYFFLDTEFINCYYIQHLKSKSYKIILVQEGLNAYWRPDTFTFVRIIIRNYIHFLHLHYIKGIKNLFFNNRWGESDLVDQILVTNPEIRTDNQLSERISFLIDQSNLDSVSAIFNYDGPDQFENEILYISQGFSDTKMVILENVHISLLSDLVQKFGKKLIVKLHPGIAKDKPYLRRKNANIYVIAKNFPIELIIARMKKSIIISPFSGSNFFYVKTNVYYWSYPVFFPNWKNRVIPNHINLVDDFDNFLAEIEFYLCQMLGTK